MCWTQGRSTHYWLVQVNFFEVHSNALSSSFPKIYSFVYPRCKANSLRCAPCTVVTPKPPFLGKVDCHFLIGSLIIGLHRRSHSISLPCLGHTQYLLQPEYHLPHLSSLSFSSFWLFCTSPPPSNWDLELLAHRRKYSILSSHLLQIWHIGLWCHGCLICQFLKRSTLGQRTSWPRRSPKTLFGGNAPQHVVPARCRSRSHRANTSQAMSCLSNVLDYIQIGCACGHTLLLSFCFVICPLRQCSSPSWQQWCWTEGSSRPAFTKEHSATAGFQQA